MVYPAAPWLLQHDLWYDTDLNQDMNGDGVNLLMSYALNLDPNLNLSGSLPAPTIGPGTLSLTFYAASPGVRNPEVMRRDFARCGLPTVDTQI